MTDKYERGFSFAGYQANNPNRPLPGTSLDAELENVERAINETSRELSDIRRADGQLRNGIVGVDALAPDIITGVRPAMLWQTGIVYQAQDTVSFGAAFYRCVAPHTSTVFATDLAANRWQVFADLGTLPVDTQTARNEAVAAAATATTQAGVATGAAATATSAAGSASASAATATATLDLFDDRYLGEKTSLPTLDNDGNALVDGTLVSLTGQVVPANNAMYVRRNGAWEFAAAPSRGVFLGYRYVATAGQTTFSGLDATGATLAYTIGAIVVTLNGATLAPNAFTATNGTSVVLTSPASLGDTVVIYSFGTFSAADTWTKAEADARYYTQPVSDARYIRQDYRNRAVNVAAQISQERGTTAVDVTTGTAYVIDQVRAVVSTTPGGTLRAQQVAGFTPNGAPNFVRFTAQVADVSLAAGDYYGFDLPHEGNMVADARFGSASARQVIKRFAFRSSLAGAFHFFVQNSARNRSRVFPFTIGAGEVNTWVTRTFVIPPDTSGTWLTDTGTGMICGVTLAAGTTFNGTAGAWQAGDVRSVAGATNFMGTGAFETFDVSETGLYVDPLNVGAPPPWEMPAIDDELARSQRYACRVNYMLSAPAVDSSGVIYGAVQYPRPMRVTPVIQITPTGSSNAGTVTASSWSGVPNNTIAALQVPGIAVGALMFAHGTVFADARL